MKKQLAIFLFIVVFTVGNLSMVLATVPTAADATLTLDEDTSYTLAEADFGFSDVDGDVFESITIKTPITLPTGATLELASVTVVGDQVISVADINAGDLVFTPAADEHGSSYASFGFIVTDDAAEDSAASNSITFDVTAVNDAPVFDTAEPADVTLDVAAGDFLDLLFEATDIDADTLTLSMSGLPSTATFADNGDGTADLDWTPIASEEGEYTVTVTLSDGVAADVTQEFDVIVDDGVNDVPVLAAIGAQEVMATVELDLDFSATDGDVGDVLSFGISSDLPVEALFVDNGDGSATLTWTPTEDDEGDYTVTITVTDSSSATDEETFAIEVVDFAEDEEITLAELEDTFEELEDTFDDFDRDFCREHRRDDDDDMDDIEEEVEDLLDQDLDDLQDAIDDLDDAIDDADLDDDLEDDLFDDLDDLQNDLDNLIDEVEDWLADSADERCTTSTSLSGDSASTYTAPLTGSITGATTTSAPAEDSEPSVTVTSITPPQTSGVVVSTTEGSSFASWENMRVLVWLVAGTVVGLAAIVFLLALLFTSGRKRRY